MGQSAIESKEALLIPVSNIEERNTRELIKDGAVGTVSESGNNRS